MDGSKTERDTFLYYRQRVREAFDVPQEERTKGLIEALRSTVYGCCDDYADRTGCSCLWHAEED